MATIKLTLFFCLFNLIISENIYLCLVPLIWDADFDKDMQICALRATKDDPDRTKNILSTFKQFIIEGIQGQLTEDNLASLNYIVEDFFNDKGSGLSNFFNVIKNDGTIIDYIINIIEITSSEGETDKEQDDLVLQNFVSILNVGGFDTVTNFLFEQKYITTILDVVENNFLKDPSYKNIFNIIKPLTVKYPVILFRFLYNVAKALNDRNRLLN